MELTHSENQAHDLGEDSLAVLPGEPTETVRVQVGALRPCGSKVAHGRLAPEDLEGMRAAARTWSLLRS
jgi:hypothetical protein